MTKHTIKKILHQWLVRFLFPFLFPVSVSSFSFHFISVSCFSICPSWSTTSHTWLHSKSCYAYILLLLHGGSCMWLSFSGVVWCERSQDPTWPARFSYLTWSPRGWCFCWSCCLTRMTIHFCTEVFWVPVCTVSVIATYHLLAICRFMYQYYGYLNL